jgi:Zn-dependent peptidase ImmA (M78 family)
MNIKLINSKVTSILREFDVTSPPVMIEDIAKNRGLKVLPYPLGDDVSGLLSIENGIGTIGYKESEPEVRTRFTIAHELGHYELHRDKSDLFVDKQFIYRSQNSGDTAERKIMEQEANYFASAILIPTTLLRAEVEKTDFDLGSETGIQHLADTFNVSTTAMSIRISSLGLIY